MFEGVRGTQWGQGDKKEPTHTGVLNVILHPGRTFGLESKILLKGDFRRIG